MRARFARGASMSALLLALCALASLLGVARGGGSPSPSPVHCSARWIDVNKGGCPSCGPGTYSKRYQIDRDPAYDGRRCPHVNGHVSYGHDCEAPPCPPPPPSPPPPSPPPPPPGQFVPVQVSINDPVPRVSDAYDFHILTSHPSCDSQNDCFESHIETDVSEHHVGLRCDVTVQKKDQVCATFGRHMPCRLWNDFYPTTLTLTDEHGHIVEGDYVIEYECYFELANGELVPEPTKVKKTLHEFSVSKGCDLKMNLNRDSKAELAAYLLSGANEFNIADCSSLKSIYAAKEAVFRIFDSNPSDGRLDHEEILIGVEAHSMDTQIVNHWKDIVDAEGGDGLFLTLSNFMSADIAPRGCQSGAGDVVTFTEATYPTSDPGRETGSRQCGEMAGSMKTTWSFPRSMQLGDWSCVYIDGLLYSQLLAQTSRNAVSMQNSVTDIRPVIGSFHDAEQSLAAHFTFAGVSNARLISSESPRADGQEVVPTLSIDDTYTGSLRVFTASQHGKHGACLNSCQGCTFHSYKYIGEPFKNDFAVSMQIFIPKQLSSNSEPLMSFTSDASGSMQHSIKLRLGTALSKFSLQFIHEKVNSVTGHRDELSEPIPLGAFGRWTSIGFSFHPKDGLTLYRFSVEGGRVTHEIKVPSNNDEWKSRLRDTLHLMHRREFFKENRIKYDDLRVYTGRVKNNTFIDAYECDALGAQCAPRAHATPNSRRVVCVMLDVHDSSGGDARAPYSCTGALYYDGGAIEVRAKMDLTGVAFEFRDTAWHESSFEILRRTHDPSGDNAFDTVVLVDGGLNGCASMFSSITYLDREAGQQPNSRWQYKIKTKTDDVDVSFVSLTTHFKTPWIGQIVGEVMAGKSVVPVGEVRICADFVKPDGTFLMYRSHNHSNLALHMPVVHTSNLTISAEQQAHRATDGLHLKPDSIRVARGQYLRVNLDYWSAIQEVEVCTATGENNFRTFVREFDPGYSVNHGHECKLRETNATQTFSASRVTCFFFTCRGSKLTTLHGQFVTAAVEEGDDVRMTQIRVVGQRGRCTFTAISDDDGRYAIDVLDRSGNVPVKANMLIGAYKEEVFGEEFEVPLLDTSDSDGDDDSLNVPTRVLLVLRRKNSSLAARLGHEVPDYSSSYYDGETHQYLDQHGYSPPYGSSNYDGETHQYPDQHGYSPPFGNTPYVHTIYDNAYDSGVPAAKVEFQSLTNLRLENTTLMKKDGVADGWNAGGSSNQSMFNVTGRFTGMDAVEGIRVECSCDDGEYVVGLSYAEHIANFSKAATEFAIHCRGKGYEPAIISGGRSYANSNNYRMAMETRPSHHMTDLYDVYQSTDITSSPPISTANDFSYAAAQRRLLAPTSSYPARSPTSNEYPTTSPTPSSQLLNSYPQSYDAQTNEYPQSYDATTSTYFPPYHIDDYLDRGYRSNMCMKKTFTIKLTRSGRVLFYETQGHWLYDHPVQHENFHHTQTWQTGGQSPPYGYTEQTPPYGYAEQTPPYSARDKSSLGAHADVSHTGQALHEYHEPAQLIVPVAYAERAHSPLFVRMVVISQNVTLSDADIRLSLIHI